jgi:hypothetical protein
MAKEKTVKEVATEVIQKAEPSVGLSELAQALVAAIEATKGPQKKSVFTRKKGTPWTPPPGVARLKPKRKMFHHGMLIADPSDPLTYTRLSNDEIELLNQIKLGSYCSGWVKVYRRKDRGVDIEYPIRTAAQRLKLVNEFGIRNFRELLENIIREGNAPKKTEDDDLL